MLALHESRDRLDRYQLSMCRGGDWMCWLCFVRWRGGLGSQRWSRWNPRGAHVVCPLVGWWEEGRVREGPLVVAWSGHGHWWRLRASFMSLWCRRPLRLQSHSMVLPRRLRRLRRGRREHGIIGGHVCEVVGEKGVCVNSY